MPTSSAQLEAIFADLKSLADGAFPASCKACGAVYEDLQALVSRTGPAAGGTGLREVPEAGAPQADASRAGEPRTDDSREPPLRVPPFRVELQRRCACGAELRAQFDDRRDRDELGMKRRQLFDRLLGLLTEGGMPRATAKRELLKVMRGQGSELLGNDQLSRFFFLS